MIWGLSTNNENPFFEDVCVLGTARCFITNYQSESKSQLTLFTLLLSTYYSSQHGMVHHFHRNNWPNLFYFPN